MTKVTAEELQEINQLREEMTAVVTTAGQLSLQIALQEDELKQLKSDHTAKTEQFKELLTKEETLVIRLREKYGTGSINFDTGEIT